MDRAFAPLDIHCQVAGEVNSTVTQVGAVLAGLGASVFPWLSLRLLQPRGDLVIRPLDGSRLYRDVVTVTKPQAARSRASALVQAQLQQLLQEIYGPLVCDR